MPNWFFALPILLAVILIYFICCSISLVGFVFAKKFFIKVDLHEVIGKVVWQTVLFFSTLFITFWIATNINNLDVLHTVSQQEAHEIENIYNAANSIPGKDKENIQTALLNYLYAINNYEYPQLEKGNRSEISDSRYNELIKVIYRYTPNGTTNNELAYGRLLRVLDDMSDYRIKRLGLLKGELTGALLSFFILMISVGCFWTGCINSKSFIFTLIVIMSQNLVIASSSWLIFEIDKPSQGYFRVNNSAFIEAANEIKKLKF